MKNKKNTFNAYHSLQTSTLFEGCGENGDVRCLIFTLLFGEFEVVLKLDIKRWSVPKHFDQYGCSFYSIRPNRF